MIEEKNESEIGTETDSNSQTYEVESTDSEAEGTANPGDSVAGEEPESLVGEAADEPNVLDEAAGSDEGDAVQVESVGDEAATVGLDNHGPESLVGVEFVDESGDEETEVIIFDADAEDADEERQRLAAVAPETEVPVENQNGESVEEPPAVRGMAELMAIVEALIFVSDEPLTAKAIAELLKEEKGWVQTAVEALAQ
jgi:hypothetical protein